MGYGKVLPPKFEPDVDQESLNNGYPYPILLEIPGQGKSPDLHVDSNKTITHAEELQ